MSSRVEPRSRARSQNVSPKDKQQALDRLARLCGIQLDYEDVWGKRHQVSERTKRLLLQAMGVPADNEEEVRASLDERLRRRWSRPLPTVVVQQQGKPLSIPLILPGPTDADRYQWRIVEEQGAVQEGPFCAGQLEELETIDLGGEVLCCRALNIPIPDLPLGYHTLTLLREDQELAQMSVIITPRRCHLPGVLAEGGRLWGMAVQLYGVRSRRNWGIGDYSDLVGLMEQVAAQGGSLVGLNPLHALFPHNPFHESPYCPSSRRFFNIFYLDVTRIPEFHHCEEARRRVADPDFQDQLGKLRQKELVDHGWMASLKRPLLELCYQTFRSQHLEPGSQRGRAFQQYQQQEGEELHLHALSEALQEHFHAQDHGIWGWPCWPEAFRDPSSPEVSSFAEANQERIEFFQYLQWQADSQLHAAARRAGELGLEVGIYQDLSVSVDLAGTEVWSEQELFALQASVGAPPDALGPQGQNWGLPPMIPDRLREAAYQPLISILRHNMRHAGALRIDHVMGLVRLFWIPRGLTPTDGAYISYPVEDMLGIVALESQRNQCLVIGEDLGTVPESIRRTLAPMGILSYRLLIFERDGQRFKPPQEYPAQSLVAATTHDLPTLTGYWEGEDLRLRDELDLFPSKEIRRSMKDSRAEDRALLLQALARQGLLPDGLAPDPALHPKMTRELTSAFHAYIAQTPAMVLMVQFEDLLGQLGQANLPGTTHQHPNWKRRLSLTIEELAQDPRAAALASLLASFRGRGQNHAG